jgi:3-oxoacyl-[acyl-carrier-protein] synthase-1
MKRAAHIVGRGVRSPLGEGRRPFLDAIIAGESALRPIDRLAGTDCLTSVAAEVDAATLQAAGGESKLPLYLATGAAREALSEAGEPERGRMGLVLSTTKGDLSGIWGEGRGLGNPGLACDRLADELELGGRRTGVSCACASGLSAIALAARWIEDGELDQVLVVGSDGLSSFVLRGFSSLLALDSGPCRPFDASRKGLSLGEAAGALLLSAEPTDACDVRVAGWGESNDANHITGPCRDGDGLYLAAHRALDLAGLEPRDIAYAHLHGTGTIFNDEMEAKALVRLFGGRTAPASGTKRQTGHTLGAAGLIESLVTIEALERGLAPANAGLEEVGVHSELNLLHAPLEFGPHVAGGACHALKLAAGFGGINAALVFTLGGAR